MEKNVVFSIVKPFGKLLQTAGINKWCAIICDYRTNNAQEYRRLGYKIKKALGNMKNHIEIRFIALYPKLNNE